MDIKRYKYGINMAPPVAPIISSSDGPQAGDIDVGCQVLGLARPGEDTYTKAEGRTWPSVPGFWWDLTDLTIKELGKLGFYHFYHEKLGWNGI